MKVAMIGCGKLGLPCAKVMQDAGHDVIGFDPYPNPSSPFPIYDTIGEQVQDRDIIFIAVPTPHEQGYGGETPTTHLPPKNFDYTIVKEVLNRLNDYCTDEQLVVLISTALPGTNTHELGADELKYRYIYNPYLIAMGSVEWDMVNPDMVIIGTSDGDETADAKILIDFYKTMMQNDPRYVVGTWEEAECIKIFYNSWISSKIALVNMIQDVSMRVGHIDTDVVTTALAGSTKRITGPAYMKAGMGDGGACVHPDTLIYSDRGLVRIADIQVGDKVIGEDGKFHNVERVWVNKHSPAGDDYDGQIIRLKSTSNLPIFITPNHEVYASMDTRKRYVTRGKVRYVNAGNGSISSQVSAVEKIRVDNLRINDHYITYPVTVEHVPRPDYATPEYIELAGYYLSEGTCVKDNRTGNYMRVSFSLHRKEENTLAARIAYLIKEIYPNTSNRVSISHKGNNGLSVRFSSRELAERLMTDFGHLCYNKFLPPWVLYSNDLTILGGIFQGDGTTNSRGVALSTTSRKLAVGVASVLRRNGIIPSAQYHPPRVGRKDRVHHRESYEVRISNAVSLQEFCDTVGMTNHHPMQSKRYLETIFFVGASSYHRVKAKDSAHYNGPVYDLQVADTHNYVSEAGLLSNCHPRDNIALSWLSSAYDLGYDYFDNISFSREQQARNIAEFMVGGNIADQEYYIHGRAYKPGVEFTDGSYSELIGYYIKQLSGKSPIYVDPLTGDMVDEIDGMVLMAHHAPTTYSHSKIIGSSSQKFYAPIVAGSTVIDIWRYLSPEDVKGCLLIHYGNTRDNMFVRPQQD